MRQLTGPQREGFEPPREELSRLLRCRVSRRREQILAFHAVSAFGEQLQHEFGREIGIGCEHHALAVRHEACKAFARRGNWPDGGKLLFGLDRGRALGLLRRPSEATSGDTIDVLQRHLCDALAGLGLDVHAQPIPILGAAREQAFVAQAQSDHTE